MLDSLYGYEKVRSWFQKLHQPSFLKNRPRTTEDTAFDPSRSGDGVLDFK